MRSAQFNLKSECKMSFGYRQHNLSNPLIKHNHNITDGNEFKNQELFIFREITEIPCL